MLNRLKNDPKVPIPILLPVLLLVSINSLFIFSGEVVRNQILTQRQAYFNTLQFQLTENIKNRYLKYENDLFGAAYFFNAFNQVTHVAWQHYYNFLKKEERFPGFLSLGLAEYVKQEDLPNLVAELLQKDPEFKVKMLTKAGEYIVLKFLEPELNHITFGSEILDHPASKIALEQARNEGALVITSKIKIASEDWEKSVFILFFPIYKGSEIPTTPGERQNSIKGFVLAVVSANEFFKTILPNDLHELLSLQVKDVHTKTQNELIYDTNQEFKEVDSFMHPAIKTAELFALGGKVWQIEVQNTEAFNKLFVMDRVLVIWLSGLFLSILSSLSLVVWRQRLFSLGKVKWLEEEKQRLRELNQELDRRVAERTTEMTAMMKELETYSYSISHDLRTPLRSISGFCKALQEDYLDHLPQQAQHYLLRIIHSSNRMGRMIDDLMRLSRFSFHELLLSEVDLSAMAKGIAKELDDLDNNRKIDWRIQEDLFAKADSGLLDQLFFNLLGNAAKFSRNNTAATVEFGRLSSEEPYIYYVIDNGIGFNMETANTLFTAFKRLSNAKNFDGTGIGLAIAQRVVQRHGGRIWAQAEVNRGAAFYFTLSAPQPKPT